MMANENWKTGRLFAITANISAWSLIVLGGGSLLISLVFFSWSGVFVSLAVVCHGLVELACKNRFFANGDPVFKNRMALNQLGLATSISAYAVWNIYAVDTDRLAEQLLASDLVRISIELNPSFTLEMIISLLPQLVTLFYGAVILVACLGCGLTAFLFWKEKGVVAA